VKGDSCVSLWWGYVVHCLGKSVKLFTAILSYFVAFFGSFFFGWGRGTGVWVWSFWLWFEEFWVF